MVRKVLLCLCCLMALTVTSMAAPSVNGYTGLIDNPSADVLRPGHFSLGYYHIHDGDVGILNVHLVRNVELGIAGNSYFGQPNKAVVNAKFALANEKILTPGIAVGIEDIGDVHNRSLYAVASKALPFGFRLHVGLGSGRFDGAFASLEKIINPVSIVPGSKGFPVTTLMLEHNGKTLNYGARFSLAPGLKLDAGWRSHDFYMGMSFTK